MSRHVQILRRSNIATTRRAGKRNLVELTPTAFRILSAALPIRP